MNNFFHKLLDRVNGLDIKIRYAVFALGILLVMGLDYALLLRLQINHLSKIREEIKTLSADTGRVKDNIQRGNEIKKDLEGMRDQLLAVDNKIRSVFEVPALFEDISRSANITGVKIDQLMPLKDKQESLLETPGAKYYALPIVIGTRCAYHVFGRFLNKLESGNLLFLVRDLRMESNDKDAANISIQATLKVILVDKIPEPKR